jgi:response regulator RpfG family c-di-GMP phosphodiesterase
MTTATKSETILIVDDEEPIRRPLKRMLTKKGYPCLEADCANQAMLRLDENSVALAILDVRMPVKSGIELLSDIKAGYPDTAVIMATAVIEPEVIIQCMKNGALDYIMKPFEFDKVIRSMEIALRKRQLAMTLKDFQDTLKGKVDEQATEIRRLFLASIQSLVFALESKDKYTAGHSRRVSEFTLIIAHYMGIPPEELEDIRYGALLHDVGKIAIDPDIQNKPGKLTVDEYEHIMTHATVGPAIVKPIANQNIIDIIHYHHCRFDGRSKDQTLTGAQIPLGVRIVTLADSFDAMTSERPYRKGLSLDAALREVIRCTGSQFDPEIVDVFIRIPQREIKAIMALQ